MAARNVVLIAGGAAHIEVAAIKAVVLFRQEALFDGIGLGFHGGERSGVNDGGLGFAQGNGLRRRSEM